MRIDGFFETINEQGIEFITTVILLNYTQRVILKIQEYFRNTSDFLSFLALLTVVKPKAQ
jgi:hypothetical protein